MRKERLPKPEFLKMELSMIQDLSRRFDEIEEGYTWAVDLGCDPRAGSSEVKVRTSGSDYVIEASTTNDRARQYRGLAQRIYERTQQARQILENLLVLCETQGVQQAKVSKDATMTQAEFDRLLLRKRMAG